GVNGPAVVASFYPYQFLASRVAGDRFAVSALVPPGVEPHDWEPTPRDVLTIGTASAFVYNGFVEAYLPNLLKDRPLDHPLPTEAHATRPPSPTRARRVRACLPYTCAETLRTAHLHTPLTTRRHPTPPP